MQIVMVHPHAKKEVASLIYGVDGPMRSAGHILFKSGHMNLQKERP